MDERRDMRSDIEERMEFYSRFRRTEGRPWKKVHAKIDRARIESVNGTLYAIEFGRLSLVQSLGSGNEHHGEIPIDSPIPAFVGISNSLSRESAPESEMVELALVRVETHDGAPEAVAARQLGKTHDRELVETTELSESVFAIVFFNTL